MDLVRRFLQLESAGGILLIAAAFMAILVNNSALSPLYDKLLTLPFTISLGNAGLSKPLVLWINDGLMAVFFMLVALEVKRELLEGHLSKREQIMLPLFAAVGGMAIPALIYAAINLDDPAALRGWAVPAATDIAFALGIMMLLGDRVPISLKVLLTTVAIIDDLGAIVIIAIFYTAELSVTSLALAGAALVGLFLLNRYRVTGLGAYILVGLLLWVFVLKSGVHATLAGVAVGFAIPLRAADHHGESPLKHLEHMLHPWVAYAILPLFAFANAGLPLLNLSLADLASPIPLGIALGLFIGKPVGVLAGAWLAMKTVRAPMPEGADWRGLIGMGALTGVGFTMSLFIGSLAFEGPDAVNAVRLGVLLGSVASALLGYWVLRGLTAQGAAQASGVTARK